jgi:Raf kinase inhibitor-like YbhB/YbcL family protein
VQIESPAFSEGGSVPVRFTCDGDDISPPLRWSGVPEGASELRLSVTDPDAPRGTFTHWLVTGIDPSTQGVDEGTLPAGGSEEENSFGEMSYGGPCPPHGSRHRYVFSVEALDPSGTVVASGRLTATFGH